jgi:hypothetical protein
MWVLGSSPINWAHRAPGKAHWGFAVGKIDNSGEWPIAQICLLRQKYCRMPNEGKAKRTQKRSKQYVFPSPPFLWGEAWFGVELAVGDF